MRSPSDLAHALRASGRKVTPQRQLVARLLHGNESHPTAESLYSAAVDQMPGISLRTVYSVLGELADLGEIQVLDIGTGSARFDPNVGEHHHLVCTSCGAVHDVDVHFDGLRVPAAQGRGFAITSAEVVFRGICPRCAASGGASATADPSDASH
jgi:Fur family transcriptional regulator, stress-responsive regulator